MKPALAVAVLAAAVGLVLWLGAERGAPASDDASPAPAPVALERTSAVGAPPAPAARTELETGPGRAAVAARPLVLTIRTAASFWRDAPAVGEIAFEVLAQTPVPQEPDGSLLPPLPLDPDSAPLARGRTDAGGTARIELDAGAVQERERRDDGMPLVGARVVEPGYQTHAAVAVEARDAPGTFEIRLMARRGASVGGRVVDATGEPVRARVELREWRTIQGKHLLAPVTSARALARGGFELHLDEPVAGGILLADAGDAGTASLAGLSIALDAPPHDLRVVATGPGVLRGRVVDGAGAPAAGVDLLFVLAELGETTSAALPEPLASVRRAEGGGRIARGLSTGADGAFEVRGLRDAPFVVKAWSGADGFTRLLTPAPVRPDGAALELRLARPHLLVRLVGADGGEPEETTGPPGSGADPTGWRETPRVVVHACAAGEHEPCVAGELLRTKRLDPAHTVCEVEPGSHVLVAALGGDFDGEVQRVDVPPGSDRIDVELRARPAERATLDVTVLHAGAEVLRQAEVRLERLEGALPVLASKDHREPGPIRFVAPPGAYRVVAEGRPSVDLQHGHLFAERALGRAEAEVVLRPGEARTLALELDAGGFVEVSLAGRASDADRAAARAAAPWLAEHGDAADIERRARAAELLLLHPGRRPEPLEHVEAADRFARRLTRRWPLGETHVSAMVPAGVHVLVARLPGGREVRATVVVRPGETVPVALALGGDAPGER